MGAIGITVVFVLAAGASAQAPTESTEKVYVGSERCGSCHPQQFEQQSAGGHALTLRRPEAHPLANRFLPEKIMTRAPKYRFRFRRQNGEFMVAADDGEYVFELPLEWAFGAGSHGVTFVSQVDNGLYLEHALSYYRRAAGLDITTGHESIQPETLHQAMGLIYPARHESEGIDRCFACHSTGPLEFSGAGQIEVQEQGVRCEACHGAGGAHVDVAARGDISPAREAISNPGRLTAVELNHLCGECHRRPEAGAERAFDYNRPWNVRHQPPFLARSACFQQSEGRLSCLTCHDAHAPLVRDDPGFYRERCLNCHGGEPRPVAAACGEPTEADCVACHLPIVEVTRNLRFTNHWIGVYTAASALQPRIR